ncbi:RNA polymerase sigma factor [uncultured Amnibacterium sp.]|uniref:RNA polymerase sigma factor n=1 Tax=uncultured Amnibacterium sp. TaxID=1631851 RepID=UPI0035CA5935
MTSRDRHEARFTGLMKAVGPDLLRYFERRAGPDGADLLTELMVIAWRKHRRIPDEPVAARMWLYGIARNLARNSLRGTIRRDRAGEALRVLAERTSQQPDPVEAIAVRDLIDRLDPDLAEVLTLVHWDGFSQAEIGRLLGIPASTVRGRYQRAKAALRADLLTAADGDGPGGRGSIAEAVPGRDAS